MGLINGLLDVGKKGIMAQRAAIHVTGHNISNVNTPGYSKQSVVLATANPVNVGGHVMGTGLEVDKVKRSFDIFIERRLAFESSLYGKNNAWEKSVSKVEALFSESTGLGLNEEISRFFNAFHDLANNPEGYTERALLKTRGEALAQTFNSMDSNLNDMRGSIDKDIEVMVEEINEITTEIATLNDSVVAMEHGHIEANDFRDRRNLLLRNLSEMIDVTYYEDSDGNLNIQASGGLLLVSGINSYNLLTAANGTPTDASYEHLDIFSVGEAGVLTNITTRIQGGELGGSILARDTDIPAYLARVDQLAFDLATQVNTVHSAGYGLVDGISRDFFVAPAAVNDAARNLRLEADILNNVNNIAASQSLDAALNPVPGDNRNALALANLQSILTMDGGTATFDDYYNTTVSDIGIRVQQATFSIEHQEAIINQLNIQREGVSGVSLDEEMANMVKFQQAFQASAKLINVADEMLTTIISIVGR